MRTTKLLVILALAAPILQTGSSAQEANAEKYPPGDIVLQVDKGFEAEKAGMKPGDEIVSVDGVPIRFGSHIALVRDRARLAGKKSLSVKIRRKSETLTLSLGIGSRFGIVEHAPFSAAVQTFYEAATARPEQKAQGLLQLKAAAEAAEKEADLRAAASLWREIYYQWAVSSEDKAAALTEERRCAEQAGDLLDVAGAIRNMGMVYEERGALDEAENYHKQALAIREKQATGTLDVAYSCSDLGSLAVRRGKLEQHPVREPLL